MIWDEKEYPFQTGASLYIPRQDSFDYELKAFWEDHMRIDPWMGLKTLEPLGSSNRLRKKVYYASSTLRRKLNGRKEIAVHSINQIP